jgi:Ner family transcriptional regulator
MDWHSEDVKAAIRKRGSTLTALAKSNGITLQALSRAILERSSARAENIIAEFIGVHPMQIWPSRYDGKGERLSLLEAQQVAA